MTLSTFCIFANIVHLFMKGDLYMVVNKPEYVKNEKCNKYNIILSVKSTYESGDDMNGNCFTEYECGATSFEDYMRYPGCKDHTYDFSCDNCCYHKVSSPK